MRGGRSCSEPTWTIAVLPDTQIYARQYPDFLEAQTRWIAEQARERPIAFALHEGDLVHDPVDRQWEAVHRAFGHLDGRVPYALAAGNHDYGPEGCASDRRTRLHEYFPPERLAPWLTGCFEADRIDNAHYMFDSPSGPWLVVVLEFAPRPTVMQWADAVLRRSAPIPSIVLTHAYLYSDGTRYDCQRRTDQKWSPRAYGVARDPNVGCDGEQIFQRLVRPHPHVRFVFCGHVLNEGVARLTSLQQGGGVVHQLLANYQHRRRGGDGYMRLLEIDERLTRCRVRTYSPVRERYKRGPAHDFHLALWPRGGAKGPDP